LGDGTVRQREVQEKPSANGDESDYTCGDALAGQTTA
jgi:hypothetical protein